MDIDKSEIHATHLRQLNIFDPVEHSYDKCIVIGAGSLGSWITIGLAKLGIQNIEVYDDDTVEEQNSANQIYSLDNLGEKKVDSLVEITKQLTGVEIEKHDEQVDEDTRLGLTMNSVVIVATDNMSSRKLIYELVKDRGVGRFIDARMSGEVSRIYSVNPSVQEDKELYEDSLYTDEESVDEDCQARSVIYNATFISSIVVNMVKEALQEDDLSPREVIYDFKTHHYQE